LPKTPNFKIKAAAGTSSKNNISTDAEISKNIEENIEGESTRDTLAPNQDRGQILPHPPHMTLKLFGGQIQGRQNQLNTIKK
jgi:hypothetical protein